MFNWFKRSSKSVPGNPPVQRKEQRLREPIWELRIPAPADPAGRRLAKGPAAIGEPAAARLGADPLSPATEGSGSGARPLSTHAQRILARLPPAASLDKTCARFPHVVESLLRHWSDHAAFRRTVDSLMIDSRGNRQGFPFDVMMELTALREYYNVSVDPLKTKGWEETDVR